MRKYIYNILIICVFIGLQNNCHAQRKETFRAFEDSIIHMHRQILNEYNATLRYQKNEKLLQLFHDVLEQRNSINYSFDSIKTISILTSPDKKVRIVTWYLIDDSGMHDHFGYIQAYHNEKGKYVVYPLTDCWNKIVNPATQSLTPDYWFGAIYTRLIQVKDENKTYYTLLGRNGGNVFSKFYVIEVLSFNHDRPVFGANIFRNYGKRNMRVLFEQAPVGYFHLSYEKQAYLQKNEKKKGKKDGKKEPNSMDTLFTDMIIFDRLIPMDESLSRLPQYYVGESSLNDAFIEQNGKWYFKSNVLGRSKDLETRRGRNGEEEISIHEKKRNNIYYKPEKR